MIVLNRRLMPGRVYFKYAQQNFEPGLDTRFVYKTIEKKLNEALQMGCTQVH